MSDIYLYGMTVFSTLHLLDGSYPEADTYGEIRETHLLPGGETGNSAIILANFGYPVKIDGPYLGTQTNDGILQFYTKYNIDCSNLHFDPGFEGVQDIVLIDRHSRTVFGKFASFFRGPKRWNQPDRKAIESSKIVSVDPFFGDESKLIAQYCQETGKAFVTIDCAPESILHRNAAATVISNEFIKNNYPNENIENLFNVYAQNSNGLTVFTFGSREILYGRKNSGINRLIPYQVTVKSTLGAGDTFRAGIVYGILNRFSDENTVKFAAATAALVCTRFPMALNPPSLHEILELAK